MTAVSQVIEQLRDRGAKVIASALAIEDVIVEILANTLFSEVKKHRALAVGLIFQSDWCSFSAKRKLLLAAIGEFSLLASKEKVQLDEALAHVMRYRNAFAHGAIEFDGSTYVLRYFESTPKMSILDDVYWEKLESRLNEPWEQLLQIEAKALEPRG